MLADRSTFQALQTLGLLLIRNTELNHDTRFEIILSFTTNTNTSAKGILTSSSIFCGYSQFSDGLAYAQRIEWVRLLDTARNLNTI